MTPRLFTTEDLTHRVPRARNLPYTACSLGQDTGTLCSSLPDWAAGVGNLSKL